MSKNFRVIGVQTNFSNVVNTPPAADQTDNIEYQMQQLRASVDISSIVDVTRVFSNDICGVNYGALAVHNVSSPTAYAARDASADIKVISGGAYGGVSALVAALNTFLSSNIEDDKLVGISWGLTDSPELTAIVEFNQ